MRAGRSDRIRSSIRTETTERKYGKVDKVNYSSGQREP